MSRNARSGSEAISPHTLAGLPAARAASATSLSSRSTLGSCGLKRSASRALPRSTTSVYCVRSLVPTLRKSLTAASRSAITAAAGVSTITPTGSDAFASTPSRARLAASSLTSARVRSTSSSRVTSGIMTWMSACTAARSAACVGEVDVAAQRDADAVGGDGRLLAPLLERGRELAPRALACPRLGDLRRGRVEEYGAARAVHPQCGALLDPLHRARHAEHGGNPDRVRQDRGVRGARALLAHQPDDVLAIELHREPGAQLLRHHHRGLGDSLPQLVRTAVHEVLDHANRHARKVGEAVLQAWAAGRGPHVAQFERLELERLLGREAVLADQVRDAGEELFVLEHEELSVEDASLVHAGAILGLRLQVLEVAFYVAHRGAQPTDLLLHLGAGHHAVRDVGHRPTHHDRGTHRDPRGHPDPLGDPLAHAPPPAALSSASRSSASRSSAVRCIS